jgi:cell division septation protein DedD
LRVPRVFIFFAGFPRLISLVFSFFLCFLPAAGQTSLDAELRNLEEKVRLESSGSAGAEDLKRLAGLRELSGDMEGAAASWELAAGGGRDNQALLRGAACFMALGDWERADAAIKGVLLGGGEERLQAHFLRAQMEGLRSGGTDTAALLSLLEDPAYGDYRPRIYFSLWKFSGQESWQRKLAGEFPRSPEGRLAAGTGTGAVAVTAEPSPMWLLFAAAPPAARRPAGQPAASSTAPRPPAPPQPASSSPARPPAPGETLLQAGLFSREANAQALLEKLRAAGFPALAERQSRAGGNYTAVYIRPGPDINQSIRDLKAAGFDSFPVTLGQGGG